MPKNSRARCLVAIATWMTSSRKNAITVYNTMPGKYTVEHASKEGQTLHRLFFCPFSSFNASIAAGHIGGSGSQTEASIVLMYQFWFHITDAVNTGFMWRGNVARSRLPSIVRRQYLWRLAWP